VSTTAIPTITSDVDRATTIRRVRFTSVLRSEWTKIRTVRSTLWTLLVAAALGVGLGAGISELTAHAYSSAGGQQLRMVWDPTAISTGGLALAQLAIGVLGALYITSEYSTRAINSTLTAVPRRTRLLAAKSTVLVLLTAVVAEVLAFAAFLIGQALISGQAPTANFGQPGVLRAVIGCGLYAALIGLLGLGLGTILRSAAAAISVLVAVIYVLPAIAAALPTSLENTVEKYWPTQAGAQVTAVLRQPHTLPPWGGFAVMGLFVAVVMAIATAVLNRRDA
jgi:ABC-2 type transport system permease protein